MSKYHRYQLTYPYEGKIIYRISSIKKATKKCYKEFKYLTDIKEGIFGITDIDTDTEYYFRAKNTNKKTGQLLQLYLNEVFVPLIQYNTHSKEYISYPINNILTHSETGTYNEYKSIYDKIKDQAMP